jgi:hypothetical protein
MIESMTNREIDRLVAEKVMNMDMVEDTLPQLPKYYLPEYEKTIFRDVPLFSSDISAAFEVAEKLREKGIHLDIFTFADFYEVCLGTDVYCANPSLPKAICIAALKSVKT